VSAIKVGDLVMVVRANPCGCEDRIGLTFKVTGLLDVDITGLCLTCEHSWPSGMRTLATGAKNTVNVNRLKRIPPLDELERDQIVDELTCG
jgi:hypothetical protein